MQTETPATVHVFEAAGLGKAPFKFIGLETSNDREAVNMERKNAGQIYTTNFCTSCDYCSQSIQNAYCVESSDGKRFKVGCDCIKKTGDKGLKKIISEIESKKRRIAKADKRLAIVHYENRLIDAFKAGQIGNLKELPSPIANRTEDTAFDYISWCIQYGRMGSTAIRLLKAALPEVR